MKTKMAIAAMLFAALFAYSQNLILNGDFEAGNTNFSNEYLYFTSPIGNMGQGYYCVVRDPFSVHGAFDSFGDHTTGTGLMLVANGSGAPNNVVWRQTITVATNTSYLFSAWATSANPGYPAIWYLRVNGVQQGSPGTLSSKTGLWQNNAAIWISGGSPTALLEICILNNEPGGNDFVIDDVSFRSITSTVNSTPASIQAAVEISWASVGGQRYLIQWASRTDTNQWFSLGPVVVGDGRRNSVCDPLGLNAKRFYRVIPVD